MPTNQVRMTPEGGFEWAGPGPNPWLQPQELPLVTWVDVSRQAWNWGQTGRDVDEALRRQVGQPSFQPLDRGSLLRVARACEESCRALEHLSGQLRQWWSDSGKLTETLGVVLQPCLKLAYEAQERRLAVALERFEELLKPLVAAHGEPEPQLKKKLWVDFAEGPFVGRYLQGYRVVNGLIEEADEGLCLLATLERPRRPKAMADEYKSWIKGNGKAVRDD